MISHAVLAGQIGQGGHAKDALSPSQVEERRALIVLADDNADMRDYLARLLGVAYEVEAVSNGLQALDAILKRRPDLVLSDLMMPVMDGLQLLIELRRNPDTSTIPVVLLSARDGEESSIASLQAGADDYLIKPFSAQQLLARVGAHIRLARLREEAESAMHQKEARLAQILEAVPEGILEVDLEGRILLVNEAAETMFGYSREEFLNLNIDALVPEARRGGHAQHRVDYAQKPKRRPMGSGLELSARKKDSSVFPVEVSLSPNRSEDTLKTIVLVRDITERRKADAQLEAHRAQLVSSARLAALGMMAGSVAHEINNPLSIIHASAADLLTRVKEEDDVPLEMVARNAERIQQTGNRISKIIKSMRHLAREGSQGRLCPARVAKIVEEALEVCKERFRHYSVNLLLPNIDPALCISCREIQIAQVLLNLLQNAFDAVMEQVAEKWIRLDVAVRDGSVVFSVIDSGPGVPPELTARIMEPFFTTKEVGKGTGLGLSLSRTIIEEHGGTLELREESGHTCFSFRLPRSQ